MAEWRKKMSDMDDKLLRIEELAEALKVKVATLRRWTYGHRIPFVHVGKRAVRYQLRDLEDSIWMRSQPVRTAGSGQ